MDGHSNRAFLSLLIERRFKGFIIVSKCRQDSNILTYSLIADTKMHGCSVYCGTNIRHRRPTLLLFILLPCKSFVA